MERHRREARRCAILAGRYVRRLAEDRLLIPTRLRDLHPARAAFALLAAWYLTAYVRRPGAYLLLDHVDLAVHEAGHVVFSPLGEFAGVAGGSLLQLIVPLAFALYFLRTRQPYAAFILVFWIAQSLHNVAVYIADARAQVLPLVGGEYVIHDWAYMLSRLHLLQEDRAIGDLVKAIAAVGWFGALGGALVNARRESDPLAAEDAALARAVAGGNA